MKFTKQTNKQTDYKRPSINFNKTLFPINETEEFHDPFSDLSIFLAKQIKNEILKESNPKKWSMTIQKLLLNNILPEFKKKFPKYRLGNTALQKTWSKVLYYLQMIQGEKQALKADGKLDVEFIIRENLKNYVNSNANRFVHPYNTANRLAIKISECIAAVDGERHSLSELTTVIWSSMQHLMSSTDQINIHVDLLDKLIVRIQLETIAKYRSIPHDEISSKIIKKIQNIKQIKFNEELTCALCTMLSNKLYNNLQLRKDIGDKQLLSIIDFIKNHISSDAKFLHQSVERIILLYKLSHHLSLNEAKENFKYAIDYVYAISTNSLSTSIPVLKQEIYEFIEIEIISLKNQWPDISKSEVLNHIITIFDEITKLPKIDQKYYEDLEVVIWNTINNLSRVKISTSLYQIIHEELGNVYIDHNTYSFNQIITYLLNYLKKLNKLDITNLEKKAQLWSKQNDMICNLLHFEQNCSIMGIIKNKCKNLKLNGHGEQADEFVSDILHSLLKSNQSLCIFEDQLKIRILIMYKYHWYTYLKNNNESSYSMFIKWHANELFGDSEIELPSLEQTIKEMAPLMPFTEYHQSVICEDFFRAL